MPKKELKVYEVSIIRTQRFAVSVACEDTDDAVQQIETSMEKVCSSDVDTTESALNEGPWYRRAKYLGDEREVMLTSHLALEVLD